MPYLRSPTLMPERRTLMSWDISLSPSWVSWLTMPELPVVRSSLWRLAVRLPPGATGELLRGERPGCLPRPGERSRSGELCRLLPIPLLP